MSEPFPAYCPLPCIQSSKANKLPGDIKSGKTWSLLQAMEQENNPAIPTAKSGVLLILQKIKAKQKVASPPL